MAGLFSIGDGTNTTSVVLDGVEGNIQSTWRQVAKKLNYDTLTSGDASSDPINTITEFIADTTVAGWDLDYKNQSETEAKQAAATTPIPGILLPQAAGTTP